MQPHLKAEHFASVLKKCGFYPDYGSNSDGIAHSLQAMRREKMHGDLRLIIFGRAVERV